MTYRFERTVSEDDILATTEAAVPTNIKKVTKYGGYNIISFLDVQNKEKNLKVHSTYPSRNQCQFHVDKSSR